MTRKGLELPINKERLIRLQERISRKSKVSVAVLDGDGNLLTESEILSLNYKSYDNNPNGSDTTVYQDIFMKAKTSRELEISTSSTSGLSTAALPIYSGDEIICIWIIHRFFYGSCNISPDSQEIPILNQESLKLLLDFVSILTEDLIQLKHYNSRLLDLEKQAVDLAYSDRLLGLPNSLSLEQALKHNTSWQNLIVVDITDLRKINDAYSRECGDKLLMAIKDCILGMEIENSCLYRLETADFGILIKNVEADKLRAIVRQIYERCNYPWVLSVNNQPVDIFINITIGILPVLEEAETILENLSSAIELTLDIAKKSDGIAFFDNSLNSTSKSRLKLELSLRRAVKENMKGFYVVYQPIVDPGVAVWRGVEALCRWESDEFGFISPAEFIPLAEVSGLIGAIGQWVLETSIAQIKAWGLDCIENFILDVNLSPVQLGNPGIGQMIVSMVEKYNYPPDKLCLEITESNELNLTTHILNVIEGLSNIGVVIALDDFGTGYASLSSLHKLPVKVLKTDRSFVQGMENDIFLQHLFYMMVEIAHSSNMKIVAEGVETDLQAQLLRKQGADYFQGYKFSKPLKTDEIEAQLVNFHKPSKELVSMGYARLDLSKLSDEKGGYDLHPTLYKLLNRCMQVLFSHPDGEVGINFALAYIGEALKVSRSYIFLREEDGTFSNTYEWCAPDIESNKEKLQHLNIREFSPEWLAILEKDGMLVTADIRTYEYANIGILAQKGVKAIVEFPIWREGSLYGFVGFHDCQKPHYWSREEVQMLHTLSSIIMATLGKMELQEQVYLKGLRMESMLNHLDNHIYVTDLDTYEILFANDAMQRIHGDEPIVGQICYEAIHGFSERCEFCPVPYLKEHENEKLQSEFYSEKLDAYFKIQNAIIPWEGKHKAHFEYGTNITELKQYQIEREVIRELDTFTELLDKENFIDIAKCFLDNAVLDGVNVTIAIIDFDIMGKSDLTLKYDSDKEFILCVRNLLRERVQAMDILCRYSAHGLALLLYDCDLQSADERLQFVMRVLETQAETCGYRMDVYYGIAVNSEVPDGSASHHISQLLELAEMRMMKKNNH